jgi:hypothetical protein
MKPNILSMFGKKKEVRITTINIKWHGKIHTLEGSKTAAEFLDIDIPFTNKPNENILMFQAQKKKPELILSVEVASPFKLASISPNVPVEVKQDERVVFKLKIGMPDYSYSGPLNIEMKTEDPEMVHIELTKTILKRGDRSVEVENSSSIMAVQKNGIFQQNIQLYKILTYKNEVKNVSVSEPFKLVSTDPKLPFTVSDENSYIVAFYIQANDRSYAGPLTIDLE